MRFVFDAAPGVHHIMMDLDHTFNGCYPATVVDAIPNPGSNEHFRDFNPGILESSNGPGWHPCYHENVKGDVKIALAHQDDRAYLVHQYDDPNGRHDQIVHGYAQEGFPDRSFDLAAINGLEMWSSGMSSYLRYRKVRYDYRTILPTMIDFIDYEGDFNGNDVPYWEREFRYVANTAPESKISSSNDEVILTFHCQRYYRYRGYGASWSDWEESGTRNIRFLVISTFWDSLVSDIAMLRVKAVMEDVYTSLIRTNRSIHEVDLAGVIAEAVEPIEMLPTNNIENATQLSDLTTLFPAKGIGRLLTNADDPRSWVVASADLYLWYKYAVKPTVGDVETAIRARKTSMQDYLYENKTAVYRARRNDTVRDCQVSFGAQVYIRASSADKVVAPALKALDRLGLSLTPKNVWDTLPYSFVVDWFVNTSDIMSWASIYCHSYHYTVQQVHTFVKSVYHLNYEDDLVRGHVIVSTYQRSADTLPGLNLKNKSDWGRHIFEGGALLVSAIA